MTRVRYSVRECNVKLGWLELTLEWRLTLFTLCLVPGLLGLGFWQLDRAGEKQALSDRHEARAAEPALTVTTLLASLEAADARLPADLEDRQVQFVGQFIPGKYFLLDNRLRDGRFGYEHIALVAAGPAIIPVNLGWIPGDPARMTVPEPDLPPGPHSFSGLIYLSGGRGYRLAVEDVPRELPAVIQNYDEHRYAQGLGQIEGASVLPLLVRVAQEHPLAHRADWPIVNQSPQKHTGYAVQWFTMAAVLLIAFTLRSSNLSTLLRRRPPPPA